jgi:putative membrane protein
MEREVRIIADSGISAKIEQDEWNLIAQKLASGIRDGKMTEALTEAVGHCGDLLAEHFPAHEENPNELPDGLFILEAGK